MPISPIIKCKFCGCTDLNYFYAKERMLGLGGDFKYAECLSCGSLQLDTIPEDLSLYYPSDYYSFSELSLSDSKTQLLKKLRMRAWLWFGVAWPVPAYGYWLRKIHPEFSARIADVGCGNGQLLYELFAGGYLDLHGFDPFIEREKEIAPGVFLWKKRIEESDLTFDLIMMHHSFEHMEDPLAVLNSCFQKLKPGGSMLIRCPVADAEVWKLNRDLWVQLDAPRHVIIPSVKGLKIAANQVGLEVKEILFDSSDFQFLGTELYRRGEILDIEKTNNWFTKKELKSLQKKALRYNQEGRGDQACFFLTKPIKS